jgi:toxin HigB-1
MSIAVFDRAHLWPAVTVDVQHKTTYIQTMIKSFRCPDKVDTETLYQGKRVRKFESCAAQAERRLEILDNAKAMQDLVGLPSNRFEALSGDRAGQFSIRVNQQWRVCFEWKDADAYNVEIVDYH